MRLGRRWACRAFLGSAPQFSQPSGDCHGSILLPDWAGEKGPRKREPRTLGGERWAQTLWVFGLLVQLGTYGFSSGLASQRRPSAGAPIMPPATDASR